MNTEMFTRLEVKNIVGNVGFVGTFLCAHSFCDALSFSHTLFPAFIVNDENCRVCFVSKFSTVDAINRFAIEYIGVNCMLRALVFSSGSSDGGLVIDEREKRSICV